jgi:hypothetical protein
MTSWSDGLLRSVQFWTLYLGIGLPLLGVLAGSFCVIVKSRADQEINRRETIASARVDLLAQQLQKKTEDDLRAQLDQANQRAKELESRQGSRVITPEQRAKFIELVEFSPRGRVSVTIKRGVDPATVAYAKQIREMVGAAGYDVGADVNIASGGQIPTGVFMVVGNEKHPFAGAIQHALGDIGISATGLVDDSIAEDEVRIEVGVKP